MPLIMLFCVSEEAKDFVRTALNYDFNESPFPNASEFYHLAESRVCPQTSDDFKHALNDDEDFTSDFFGASKQDCQDWLLANQLQVDFIERDILVIADARSARDNTVLITQYFEPGSCLPFEGIGMVPAKDDTWYDFRVDYKVVDQVHAHLFYGVWETVFPTYYLRRNEVSDENGVLDMQKVTTLVNGEELAPQPSSEN
ncbi:hypothetical protein K491DRAFT_644500 [Lophiostoma macrostomum CBS 122681]|uniref:Uncharacterized protein n=1 Tax=Lophiostoma macrostomum CBS 122681 TaxID=1314788 RepID=A0A6A6SK78_9PLEO|nr:hypothetical protein K491DRAFT_644500 [Lophiostoma macrostomum CBS 122681]